MISESNLLAFRSKKILLLNILFGVFFASLIIYIFVGYTFGVLGILLSIIGGLVIGTILVVFMLVIFKLISKI